MVFMQGISLGALAAVRTQPSLQIALVVVMILVLVTITSLVCFLVIRFAIRNPGLLFNPQDISPEVHRDLYVPMPPEQVKAHIGEQGTTETAR